jgi:23S rRNA pseudouridine1911/1915/1917 synthase
MEKIICEVEGIRVDSFVNEHCEIPRNSVKEMMKNGEILVNSKVQKPSYKISIGDVIEVPEFKREASTIEPQDIPLDIVYEDDYLAVINKASGMVVHPATGNFDNTLVNAILFHFNNLSSANGESRPGIVHRIDKDTSGLIIVAKDDKTHTLLSKMIKEREVSRIYYALVHGTIGEDTGTIIAPIGRDPRDRKKMCVTAVNSKKATTHFTVVERYEAYTLVECKLETGRTHQIRVHMKWITHPLCGDPVYGPKNTIDCKGQALHAKKLEFVHPITGEEMKFEIDLPTEFKEVLKVVSGSNSSQNS